ncbi:MAG: cytochrome c-type biogenesis protein CcmH [Rhizobiales bacterium]|nr:cytochrome c-type biogenesis protein CcmH [Hyphomicrobiales bacterium]
MLLAIPGFAVEPDEVLADPALEARARALSSEFRCLVCQNESIDESNAPLAKDLRILIRQRLTAGDSDTQVTNFLVDRYGEFVLLRPRLTPQTLLLWGLPFALLAIIAGFLLGRRRKINAGSETPLSAGEEERFEVLK